MIFKNHNPYIIVQTKHSWVFWMNYKLFGVSLLLIILSGVVFAETALVATDKPAKAYSYFGKYFFINGNFEKSAEFFQKSIDIQSSSPVYHDLAVALFNQGKYSTAIKAFENAINIDDKYTLSYYHLGLLYFKVQDYDKAILNLKTSAELDSSNPDYHFDLAVAYAERFRQKENGGSISAEDLDGLKTAFFYYANVLSIDKNFPNAGSNAKIVKEVIFGYGI